ncbi:hypothetical protein AB0D57_13860 [Streptomyces sp. NPDC048275]|uniref:LppU/SCO3897 family protein n=1 Tax=Streptomyces sp. NPDC048275 TaxID=3155629 RepID=UPI003410189F
MTTPPPQGQNPFAQGQQPYGQPPQGQTPYGQQQPQGYPQQPKRGIKQYLRIIGFIAVLSVVVGGWLLSSSDDAKKLAVGDCVYNKGTSDDPEVVQVDCSDSKATHTVLKKADGATLPSLTCGSVTNTTATLTWEETGESFTLCLGDNK